MIEIKNPRISNAKYAVVTRAKDDYEIGKITRAALCEYAVRCQADFLVINEEKLKLGNFFFELLQCYELFDKYERILSVDSDIIINSDCPNIFELVPYDCIGTIYEDKYCRKNNRREFIKMAQEKFGDIGWREGYINTGFFVCSRIHKELFAYSEEGLWRTDGYDDVYLGYRIHLLKFKVFELPYTFNHMSMFSEIGRNWLKSYVMHYAGRGFSRQPRHMQIKNDLQIVMNTSKFMRNFYHIPTRLRLLLIGISNLFRDRFMN